MCEKGTFSQIRSHLMIPTDQHLFMNDEDVLAPTEVITLPSNDTCTWF